MLLKNTTVGSTPEARRVLDGDKMLQRLLVSRERLKEQRSYWNNKEKEIIDEIKDLKSMVKSMEKDLPRAVAKTEAANKKLKDGRWAVRERRRFVLREAYARAHHKIRKLLGLPNLKSIDQVITEMEREDNEDNRFIQDHAGSQGEEV